MRDVRLGRSDCLMWKQIELLLWLEILCRD